MRKHLENILNSFWYEGKGAPIKLILFPIAVLYGFISWLRAKMFAWGIKEVKRLPALVISVGNITLGGTGKTPLVIHIAAMLSDFGLKPAVVSRGYGGSRAGDTINIVSDGNSILLDEALAGDEAILLAGRMPGVPVLVGKDRFALGQYAINKLGAMSLILDDGFQHLQLHRDLNICVVQTARGLGSCMPLPAGPLREFASAIKRADVVVFTSIQAGNAARVAVGGELWDKIGKPVLEVFYLPTALEKNGRRTPLTSIKGKRVCAFCGIGNPASFCETLEGLGALCVCFLPYPDHHRYSNKDIERIKQKALSARAQLIVTTEKDAVKVRRFADFFAEVSVLSVVVAPRHGDNTLLELIKQTSGRKN